MATKRTPKKRTPKKATKKRASKAPASRATVPAKPRAKKKAVKVSAPVSASAPASAPVSAPASVSGSATAASSRPPSYLEGVPQDPAELVSGLFQVFRGAAKDLKTLVTQAIAISNHKDDPFDR